jgi:hypothetical protein
MSEKLIKSVPFTQTRFPQTLPTVLALGSCIIIGSAILLGTAIAN